MARLRLEGAIFLATFAGLATYIALEIIYVATMGQLIFLTGLPTPGGAPIEIHLFNTGLKGAWTAIAYGVVMRLAFGRLHLFRLVTQWGVGMAVIVLLVGLGRVGVLSWQAVGNVALVAYVLAGQVVFRDWVSR